MSTEIETNENEISSLTEELSKQFNKEFIKVLKQIVYEVSVIGLSEKEACLLTNFEYTQLVGLKEKHEIIRRLFDMKSLQYKRGLIKTLSDRARGGDDKLAQWLLESRYPDEFNRRKGIGGGNGSDNGEDMLGAAVEFIQKSTSPQGFIRESSGRAFLVQTKGHGKKEIPANIHDSLVGRAKTVLKEIENEEAR